MDSKPVDILILTSSRSLKEKRMFALGRYRRLVGKLYYLTIIQPRCLFQVSVESQLIDKPKSTCIGKPFLEFFRYLKGAPGHGLLYRRHRQGI